jgi:hypothetical protein
MGRRISQQMSQAHFLGLWLESVGLDKCIEEAGPEPLLEIICLESPSLQIIGLTISLAFAFCLNWE